MKLTRMTRAAGWLAVAGLLGAALIGPTSALALVGPYATVSGYAPGTADNNQAATWGEDCTKLDSGDLGSSYLLTQSYAKVIVKAGSEESAPGHVNTIFNNPSAGQTVWADSNGNGLFDPGGQDGDKGISHIIFCGPVTTTTTSTDTTSTDTTSTDTTSTDTTTTATTDTTTTATTDTTTTATTDTTTTATTDTTTTQTTSTATTDTTTTGTTSTQTIDTETTETTSTGTETTSTPSGEVEAETGSPEHTLPSTDTGSVSGGSSPSGNSWQLLLVAMAGLLATVLLLTPATAARKR
ncbi:MAG: hypothetical protein ACYC65_08085 [Candidatus Limnocylindrales bacterium]